MEEKKQKLDSEAVPAPGSAEVAGRPALAGKTGEAAVAAGLADGGTGTGKGRADADKAPPAPTVSGADAVGKPNLDCPPDDGGIVSVPKDEVLAATGSAQVAGAPAPQGFKEKIWQPFLGPVVALCIICAVTSGLLAMTNNATAPLIEANTRAAADEARAALLPAADSFTPVPLTSELDGALALYEAANGAGYVAETEASGYGGAIPAMVAFDAEGNIAGVTFLENNETPGLGQNIRKDEFAGQFAGLPLGPVTLGGGVDAVTSATVSSSGAVAAVNTAVAMYEAEVLGQDVDGVAGATEASGEEGGWNEEAAEGEGGQSDAG